MQGLCLSVKSHPFCSFLFGSIPVLHRIYKLVISYGNKQKWAKHSNLLYAVCTLALNHAMHSSSWHVRSAMPIMSRTQGSEQGLPISLQTRNHNSQSKQLYPDVMEQETQAWAP